MDFETWRIIFIITHLFSFVCLLFFSAKNSDQQREIDDLEFRLAILENQRRRGEASDN